MMRHRLSLAALVVITALIAAACTGGDEAPVPTGTATGPTDGPAPSTFAAQVASTDIAVGADQRFQVGILSSTQDAGVQLVSYGEVQLAFSFLGADGSGQPVAGASATASYLPAPGTDDRGSAPTLTSPDIARGVYEADGLRFDDAGLWEVTVTATIDGGAPVRLSTNFPVLAEPALPAPGQDALSTKNLTLDSPGVKPVALDSRAQDGEPVPDPELHRWTIDEAMKQSVPSLVLFATPVYCQSQFCGPTVEAQEALAKAYVDRAVFIHVEIWKDYDKSVANDAATDWLFRSGDLTEPWLYLIGGDGVIIDRWGPLFDPDQVGHELAALPKMNG
jgi:hypothetical protein